VSCTNCAEKFLIWSLRSVHSSLVTSFCWGGGFHVRTYFIIRTGRNAKTLMLIRPKQMLKETHTHTKRKRSRDPPNVFFCLVSPPTSRLNSAHISSPLSSVQVVRAPKSISCCTFIAPVGKHCVRHMEICSKMHIRAHHHIRSISTRPFDSTDACA